MTTRTPRPGPHLLLEEEDGLRQIPLEGTALLVGRAAGCDLRLEDPSLSARHCRIEPVDGGWKVVDLESRNGTFVNDVLVQQRMLADGDRLRLGRVLLRVRLEPAAEDLLAEIGPLASRIHRRLGKDGLKTALGRFVEAAERRGVAVTPGSGGAGELEAARRLQTLLRAMIEEHRPEAIFEQILDTLIQLTGAERGFCLLEPGALGEEEEPRGDASGAHEPRIVAARNLDGEAVRDALAKVSRTVQRRVLATGDPMLVSDASSDERFTGTDSIAGLKLRSILAVPVTGREGPLGTIVLDNRFERGVFREGQLPMIRLFADQAAIALRNAALHAQAEHRLEDLERAKSEVDELNRILADRVARTSAELQEVKDHVLRERAEAPLKYSYGKIVGTSRRMTELFHLLDKVTDSDVPVLIQGESGTGKELVARAIHFNGPRAARPFISENCAAIPETLLESELFGYVKGAFTGAGADKKGLFEAANGGTLFLDEIGDMPFDMQKKLLRVLQEKELRPVGAKHTVRVDVRILAASNKDLRKASAEGRFREDLLYRLNVITVELPPLRERRDDVPLMVEAFLDEIAEETRSPRKTVSEDAMQALKAYDWPGNVRELKNEVQRAAALSDRVIVPLILSPRVRGARPSMEPVPDLGKKPLKDMVREVSEELERRVIAQALERCRGRKSQAARLLAVSRPTLDAKIEAYGLAVTRD
jgi:transcriptional regulator with GAF, ATPase, and Fis domain